MKNSVKATRREWIKEKPYDLSVTGYQTMVLSFKILLFCIKNEIIYLLKDTLWEVMYKTIIYMFFATVCT